MGNYKIVKCKECGKLFRIPEYGPYTDDPNYCPGCNRKSGEEKPTHENWK